MGQFMQCSEDTQFWEVSKSLCYPLKHYVTPIFRHWSKVAFLAFSELDRKMACTTPCCRNSYHPLLSHTSRPVPLHCPPNSHGQHCQQGANGCQLSSVLKMIEHSSRELSCCVNTSGISWPQACRGDTERSFPFGEQPVQEGVC